MRASWTTWLAISLFTLAMTGLGCVLILTYASNNLLGVLGSSQAIFTVAFASMATVGLMLSIHRPGNPIGWIFLTASIAQMIMAVAELYPEYIAESPDRTLPEPTLLFWLQNWVWIVAFILPVTFGSLLFPTGRLLSKRWRIFAWIGASQLVLFVVAIIIKSGPIEDIGWHEEVLNPTGIDSLNVLVSVIELFAGIFVFFFLFIGSIASLFLRLHRATGQERQQLKWFTYGALIPIAIILLSGIENQLFSSTIWNVAGDYLFLIGVATLPITIGIAILRHNLYDIDRLINRTAVYGSLTIMLLLSFAGSVIFFQFLLDPLTGGNDLAVAGSTLLVAALFQPARNRLQRFVDRRFYRRKYDAQQTLQAFSVTSREAVQINELTDNLTGVVATTVQPAHISIWLNRLNIREERH